MMSRVKRWPIYVMIVMLMVPLIAEAVSFSYGDTLQTHDSNFQLNTVEMGEIDDTRTLILHAADDEGYLSVVTRDGTTLVKSADYEVGAQMYRGALTMLDDTRGVIIYVDANDGEAGKAVVATVTGNSVALGTPVEFEDQANTNSNYALAVTTLDSSRFAVAYMSLENGTDMFGDPTNTNSGSLIIGSVSGTNITFGTAAVYSRDEVHDHDITALGSSKVVVTYDTDDGAFAVVGSVSGTSITLGTPAEFADTSNLNQSDALDSSRFIVTYQANSGAGMVRIGAVSGTNITYGTAHEFNSLTSTAISTATIDDTSAAIVYGDFGGGTKGTVTIATIDGTSVTTGETSIFGAYMNASSMLNLDEETLMVGYYSLDDAKGHVQLAYRDLPDAESSSSSSSSDNVPSRGGGRRGRPGRGGVAKPLSTLMEERRTTSTQGPVTEFEQRTCDRVMKWFRTDAKMLGRVNERLQKRFGFVCL